MGIPTALDIERLHRNRRHVYSDGTWPPGGAINIICTPAAGTIAFPPPGYYP
jgi:hypothetical protein